MRKKSCHSGLVAAVKARAHTSTDSELSLFPRAVPGDDHAAWMRFKGCCGGGPHFLDRFNRGHTAGIVESETPFCESGDSRKGVLSLKAAVGMIREL